MTKTCTDDGAVGEVMETAPGVESKVPSAGTETAPVDQIESAPEVENELTPSAQTETLPERHDEATPSVQQQQDMLRVLL